MELEGIHPFLKQLSAMKDQGMNGVGVVANFIRRRVHPLQERVHYDFEYVGPKDPAQVTTDELIEDEVLERIQGVLDAVSIHLLP
jgi:predicted methyltransferase MtxX (methanogen marker protein 4)